MIRETTFCFDIQVVKVKKTKQAHHLWNMPNLKKVQSANASHIKSLTVLVLQKSWSHANIARSLDIFRRMHQHSKIQAIKRRDPSFNG
jgi:hypothetical protein